jgi:thioredoxin-related protein
VKKYLLLLLFTPLAIAAIAQTDSVLLYQRFPVVPTFRLINIADSSIFTKDNLKKKKATIIMMFSPDCEHCQEETKTLTANIHLFKKAQIIMVSPLDFNYMRQFYNDYKIADYPNITMGRDPNYFLGTFFNVHSFPSFFLYNKKGKLVNKFIGGYSVQEIAAAL